MAVAGERVGSGRHPSAGRAATARPLHGPSTAVFQERSEGNRAEPVLTTAPAGSV